MKTVCELLVFVEENVFIENFHVLYLVFQKTECLCPPIVLPHSKGLAHPHHSVVLWLFMCDSRLIYLILGRSVYKTSMLT